MSNISNRQKEYMTDKINFNERNLSMENIIGLQPIEQSSDIIQNDPLVAISPNNPKDILMLPAGVKSKSKAEKLEELRRLLFNENGKLIVNQFIHADGLDVLRWLPDRCCFTLTDPPFGIGADRKRLHERKHNNTKPRKWSCNKWDKTPSVQYFNEIIRISLDYVIWGGNYFNPMLPKSEKTLCWDKKKENQKYKASDYELAFTSLKGRQEKFSYRWSGFIQEKREKLGFHPTQKPIALFVWCLEKFTKPGDLIIDPFCGSGTTAIACHLTGRNWLCIDKQVSFLNKAKKRFRHELGIDPDSPIASNISINLKPMRDEFMELILANAIPKTLSKAEEKEMKENKAFWARIDAQDLKTRVA